MRRKTTEEFYSEPNVIEMLLGGEEIKVGAKLMVQRYGELATLQLFSKHSLDRGSSILIEAQDIEPLIKILGDYGRARRTRAETTRNNAE